MKLFSANIEDLRTLYLNHLKTALDMEQEITEALPKMIENASDPQLAAAFRDHFQQTQGHVAKVEALLRKSSGDTDTITCKAIGSLVTEAEDGIKDAKDPTIRDITLISAAQEVEHHEIAAYGTLRNWASLLGLSDDAEILESILNEEKAADKLLSSISDSVNMQAAA
jgi:ferritin-like metal-binding protein YciE